MQIIMEFGEKEKVDEKELVDSFIWQFRVK